MPAMLRVGKCAIEGLRYLYDPISFFVELEFKMIKKFGFLKKYIKKSKKRIKVLKANETG